MKAPTEGDFGKSAMEEELEMGTQDRANAAAANYVRVLGDPPWVNFGKALWKYGAGGDETISVEAAAVATLIRERLTDKVLDGFFRTAASVPGSDKFFPSIRESTEYFDVFREGIVKALDVEPTKEEKT